MTGRDTYVWNDDLTEANRKASGTHRQLSFINVDGERHRKNTSCPTPINVKTVTNDMIIADRFDWSSTICGLFIAMAKTKPTRLFK